MASLKHRSGLLGPQARRWTYIAGWIALLVSILFSFGGNLLGIQLAFSVVGLALLITSVALAARSVLWRQNSLASQIRDFGNRTTVEEVNVVGSALEDRKRLPAEEPLTYLNAREIQEVIEGELKLLSLLDFSGERLSILKRISEGNVDGKILFLTAQNDVEKVSAAARLLQLKIDVINLDEESSVLWDIKKYSTVVIESGNLNPVPKIPFSWIGHSTSVLTGDTGVSRRYLEELNYGIPVKFAFAKKKSGLYEVIIRRSLA